MAKVDSKGRIVIPREVRERLGITPGTEVEVRGEEGRAIIEPEDDPEAIIDRMERLVEETSPARDGTTRLDENSDPIARDHRDAVREGADGDE